MFTIEVKEMQAYRDRMRSLALRILALVAVLTMPFGMAAASAAPAHHEAMAMPMEHCPEPASKPVSRSLLADCTMACASALPATNLEPVASHEPGSPLLDPSVPSSLSGIELEIATPPPRRA